MAKSQEVYNLSGQDLGSIKRELSAYLSRISDRLDKIEGLRAELETASGSFSGDITVTDSAIKVADGTVTIHSLE